MAAMKVMAGRLRGRGTACAGEKAFADVLGLVWRQDDDPLARPGRGSAHTDIGKAALLGHGLPDRVRVVAAGRLDALVWAVTALALSGGAGRPRVRGGSVRADGYYLLYHNQRALVEKPTPLAQGLANYAADWQSRVAGLSVIRNVYRCTINWGKRVRAGSARQEFLRFKRAASTAGHS
jgi:hypothetical protein